MKRKKVIIIGAGPAGLATAYELINLDKEKQFEISIFEMENTVGGLAKTLQHNGYRFDLGGHRFYTEFPEINQFYKTFLGIDMLKRERLSRIYYQKKFYNYPLSAPNALKNLGLTNTVKIVYSWFTRQYNRFPDEKTFDHWVSNRFGDTLFKIFFKSYTEKVWGIKTSKLSSEWAAQRIQNFNLSKAILEAVFRIKSGAKTTITSFYYPKLGPGMLYKKLQSQLEKNGVTITFHSEIIGFKRSKKNITHVVVLQGNKKRIIKPDIVISTLPFNRLAFLLDPDPKLKQQIKNLKFRNFITVNLIIKSNPFPDQWIYIHEPDVRVGRIQNFRNWSPYMVKKGENNTPVGMEYFCDEDDLLWQSSDQKLLEQAKREIVTIGLVRQDDIIDGFVYRVRNAYPIYNFDYKTPFKKVKEFISQFDNLYVCGRGGLFRYDNQDHAILTGFYVARNIHMGKKLHDVWSVNKDSNDLG